VRLRRPISILLAALLTAACTDAPIASTSGGSIAAVSVPPLELQVYAAASLKAVLAQVKAAYEAANPGITLTVSTDSSTALETKIEQGAPADLLLSADTKNPQRLVDKGLASGSVVSLAGNLLTVIVPSANPAGIAAPADLAKGGVKVIACADGVPIQTYTAQWLAKVSALPTYGAGFVSGYNANVVSREDNVGAIVAKVALGEGDAGVVYVTDATASGKVRTIAIPAEQNVPATYGGVVVASSAHADAAHAFLAWLASAKGQVILASFGFVPPTG
jgi:molybdate transport system substrate-binding protein